MAAYLRLVFVCLLIVQSTAWSSSSSLLHKLLYPNQTQFASALETHRRLQADDPTCVTCTGLEYCHVLNGYMIQEVYLPTQIAVRASCTVLEERGRQYTSTIFGPGRTFRDTDLCLDIVMQYLCLFWGTDNPMYKNDCINSEDYSDPDPANQKKVQRPPCRSFCVQVSSKRSSKLVLH